MILEGIMGAIGKVLGWVSSTIPGLNIDTTDFAEKMAFLVNGAKKVNAVLPIAEALSLVMIAIGFIVVMMAFWAAMRLVNLIRGAG